MISSVWKCIFSSSYSRIMYVAFMLVGLLPCCLEIISSWFTATFQGHHFKWLSWLLNIISVLKLQSMLFAESVNPRYLNAYYSVVLMMCFLSVPVVKWQCILTAHRSNSPILLLGCFIYNLHTVLFCIEKFIAFLTSAPRECRVLFFCLLFFLFVTSEQLRLILEAKVQQLNHRNSLLVIDLMHRIKEHQQTAKLT